MLSPYTFTDLFTVFKVNKGKIIPLICKILVVPLHSCICKRNVFL